MTREQYKSLVPGDILTSNSKMRGGSLFILVIRTPDPKYLDYGPVQCSIIYDEIDVFAGGEEFPMYMFHHWDLVEASAT